jgi:CheY-like chemotaxis protein
MRDMLTRTIGTTIQVRTAMAPDLWPAMVDPTQIEIAILNLAINARDAMPLGGTLTIEMRNLPGASRSAPRELAGRDCVCISVRDGGTGMSEEVLRSAIEPFFTTKEPGKGSGLGLSQVYGMVQQSDGALQIESELGAGTTVHLYLPRAPDAAGASEPARDQASKEKPRGRILVVDDDPGVRDIAVETLRQAGYCVIDVESGQAALDALARGEVFELMVIDVAMPGLDGIETVRRARRRWPGLRALYITGYADAVGAGLAPGSEPLLKKPFRLDDLRNAVGEAISRQQREAGIVEPEPR